ncbi:uncharacterized protein [Rutidosis leptorrhynchoides]|uniref:uncharacterized protein isoform X2 n=1 Tax=Rutidosis leptorrhynchoides TaxID=125765 RepID=UPI003A9A6651
MANGVCEIQDAVDEARDAMRILKNDHGLVLCEVWTYGYTTNGIAQCLWSTDMYFKDVFFDYVNQCINIGDGFGGLTLKALETYETYFTKLKYIKGEKKGLIPATAVESCCFLAICMKNINIEHVDYVYEMIFKLDDNNIHNPYVFLDSLFERLKSCWPSFKLSSGAQLGGHPIIVDVDTFKELEKPLKTIKKSEDALKWATVEDVDNHAAKRFEFLALKEEEEEEEDCKEDVRIYVSASVEFEDLKTKISLRFHDLVSSDNDYRVTFSLGGLSRRPLWMELEGDEDLKKCVSLCRSNEINQLPIRIIPLVQHAFRAKSRHAILEICLGEKNQCS